ncbi:MAG TPA: TetR/AcrR family transcriptional regulator [Pseudonocardia sp.]|nr:TetR/AcrR family transcriptional regulator [Pseudonocardia sp.]
MLACVALIERDGADAVSMRRVAAELGAAPMSLYNHVPNKATLLDAVAEHIMSEMDLDLGGHQPGEPESGEPDWCDQARALARNFRAVARRYPRSVLLVITRQPRSTVGLRPVELALGVVRRAGFDDQTSVRLVRTVVSFVIGSLMHEAGVDQLAAQPSAPDLAAFAATLDEAHYAQVRAVLPMLVQHDHDAEFEFGLELLIGAMQTLWNSHRKG